MIAPISDPLNPGPEEPVVPAGTRLDNTES